MLITSTMIETATPALPELSASAPDTLTILVSSCAVIAMVCALVPAAEFWLMSAPAFANAWVVRLMTSTITDPVTAADPPPALPPTATEVTAGSVNLPLSGAGSSGEIGLSVDFEVTARSFATSTQVVPAVQVLPPVASESM